MGTSSFRIMNRRIDTTRVAVLLITLVVAAVWLAPFIFMLLTSLKTQADIFQTSAFALPSTFEWGNYSYAIEKGELLKSGLNSFIIAAIKVPLGLFIAAMAAFAIARLDVPYPRVLVALFVLGTMLPIQVALSSIFRIILDMGLLNTKLGVILPYIAFGIPYQVFFLYSFLKTIPRELDESARIDGATNFQVFWSIILPLSKPALAAMFILDFLATWNEFAIALVILQKQAGWTVPLALQGFNQQFTTSYGPLNAAIIITILPVLIVYFFLQKYFVQGLYAGAVKG